MIPFRPIIRRIAKEAAFPGTCPFVPNKQCSTDCMLCMVVGTDSLHRYACAFAVQAQEMAETRRDRFEKEMREGLQVIREAVKKQDIPSREDSKKEPDFPNVI